ncbi:DUF5665 domain-containing protein [Celeribacter litoreus]|uniref:DUF5665 domain-containing protein n=1 Tax=Celeribacter litoreus TaxID=2876714 RepID=UPI001CCADCE9|nr:DUF5665 domain-containing protein [Celeribacter litoreus]MCA0041897.1 DUF5665 domain-containing protein [Celeribacter litoreus]
MTDSRDTIARDLENLTGELERLNNHRFMRIHNSTVRLIWFQFLRGLAFGFGSVVGASIVVSIVGYILNQMEVVPILGDWAKQLASEIMSDSQRVETGQ